MGVILFYHPPPPPPLKVAEKFGWGLAACTCRKMLDKTKRGPAEEPLKGPKREIFDSGVFAQIRPIWIGDLGTRPKNYKF